MRCIAGLGTLDENWCAVVNCGASGKDCGWDWESFGDFLVVILRLCCFCGDLVGLFALTLVCCCFFWEFFMLGAG